MNPGLFVELLQGNVLLVFIRFNQFHLVLAVLDPLCRSRPKIHTEGVDQKSSMNSFFCVICSFEIFYLLDEFLCFGNFRIKSFLDIKSHSILIKFDFNSLPIILVTIEILMMTYYHFEKHQIRKIFCLKESFVFKLHVISTDLRSI